jgi:glucuronate isomerase
MSDSLKQRILSELESLVLIDPHTHINPHAPASRTLADILGYHYYTELAHSAGMPKGEIESPGLSPRESVGRMVASLGHLSNTIQCEWLVELCQRLYGFEEDAITLDNWQTLYDQAESAMASADWPTTVLEKSNVEAVFLTNEFDDSLEGFDTRTYIPCLRTDDLVFKLSQPEVRQRLEAAENTRRESARDLAKRIEEVSVTFSARVGEEGRLFGSITATDIANQLETQGIEVEKRQVDLHEPIKTLGVFRVPIRLHADVRPEVRVWVIKQ